MTGRVGARPCGRYRARGTSGQYDPVAVLEAGTDKRCVTRAIWDLRSAAGPHPHSSTL